MPVPKEPVIFNKAPSCIVGANDDTIIPKDSTKLDWEVELGIVIGRRARYLTKENTKAAIAGYFVGNDVSERSFQIERSGSQWGKGKGCETFGPIGPWFVTRDEVKDVQALDMWLNVNGEKPPARQHQDDGVRRRISSVVLLAVLRHEPGRHHHHRHAAGRRPRHEAHAGVPEGRRRGDAGHPGAGRAEAEGGEGEVLESACIALGALPLPVGERVGVRGIVTSR